MKRRNPTIDGDKDQETQNRKEKRRRIEIQIRNTRRREKALKRPMPPLTSAINPDPDPESDSNSDGNQEPVTEKINDELAYRIPNEFKRVMNFMGASSNPSLRLVTEKRLTNGDVDERRNRFLIPARKIRFKFLDLEEEEFLNLKKWRPVEIIEPDCTVSLATLSKWKTKSGPAYVFITEWIGLVERNKLQEGELFQLWSFRAGGKYGRRLCFLILAMESTEDSIHSSSTESPDDLESIGDENSDEDDNNTNDVVTMNRSKKIQINSRRSREMALKRPMFSESESDSEEEGIYEVERHEDLATVITEPYRRKMSFMGATAADISRLRFVMKKRLEKCDVDGRRDLFVIPASGIRWKFLGVVEEEVLKWDRRLTVEMIEPRSTVSLVTVRKPAAAAAEYAIMEWMELVARNELVAGDTMELWCFRAAGGKYGRLCFMLLQFD